MLQMLMFFPNILNGPFMITTSVGKSVVGKRVYRNCLIMLSNRVTHVELVELDIVDLISFWGWIGCMIVLLPLIVEQKLLILIFQMNPS